MMIILFLVFASRYAKKTNTEYFYMAKIQKQLILSKFFQQKIIYHNILNAPSLVDK
jgi:hypothetical protein